MVVIINKKYLSTAHNLLNINKEKYKVLGQIIKKPENSKIIYVD